MLLFLSTSSPFGSPCGPPVGFPFAFFSVLFFSFWFPFGFLFLLVFPPSGGSFSREAASGAGAGLGGGFPRPGTETAQAKHRSAASLADSTRESSGHPSLTLETETMLEMGDPIVRDGLTVGPNIEYGASCITVAVVGPSQLPTKQGTATLGSHPAFALAFVWKPSFASQV